jgi:inner membrane protein
VLAVLLPIAFYLTDALIAKWRKRERRARFAGLLLASLIATASHPLLDWTNSYGVRPLLPWSERWFYGDLVFIVDPWLWLSIGGVAFLLTARTALRLGLWAAFAAVITLLIFVLPDRAGIPYPLLSRLLWLLGLGGLLAAHRFQLAARWGRAIAITAFALTIVYWATLSVAHRRAYTNAEKRMESFIAGTAERMQRVAATPVLANPLRWTCLAETDLATYRFDVRLDGTPALISGRRYTKPLGADADLVNAASEDERAEIFLGFARFPVTQVERNCTAETIVQFADLRYTEPGGSGRGNFGLRVPVRNKPSDMLP